MFTNFDTSQFFDAPALLPVGAASRRAAVSTSPAAEYVDGQKTGKQRTWNGKKVWRLKGVYALMNDDIVQDSYVYVTSPNVPDFPPKADLIISGHVSVRSAKGFGLACSVVGELVGYDDGEGVVYFDGFTLEEAR